MMSSKPPCVKANRTPVNELRRTFTDLNRGGTISGDTADPNNVFNQLKSEMLKCTKLDGTSTTVRRLEVVLV